MLSMPTERQRNANRANARRSTGPKTDDGKRAVRPKWTQARFVIARRGSSGRGRGGVQGFSRRTLRGPCAIRAGGGASCRARNQFRMEASSRGASGGRDPASRNAQGEDQPVGRKSPLFGATGATRVDSDEPVITNKELHTKAIRALDHAYAERDRDEALTGAQSRPMLNRVVRSAYSLGTKRGWSGACIGRSTNCVAIRRPAWTEPRRSLELRPQTNGPLRPKASWKMALLSKKGRCFVGAQ